MTTKAQKQAEERYVKMLLDGIIEYASIEAGERPDFWVRRSSPPDIAVEVTEYHPEAESAPGERRAAVEARWRIGLEPALDRERRGSPCLQDVQLRLIFNEPKLPKGREHGNLAREIVRLVEGVAGQLTGFGEDVEVCFVAREDLTKVGSRLGNMMFVAMEDWPKVSRQLSSLNVARWPGVAWPPWECPNIGGAWLGPENSELHRVLQGKAALARGYELGGAPLWLLVVCELQGDLQSHIFPRSSDDLARLLAKIEETGFDFQSGPFSNVWLLSAFTGERLRVHPLRV
jgi:hypothetical protein